MSQPGCSYLSHKKGLSLPIEGERDIGNSLNLNLNGQRALRAQSTVEEHGLSLGESPLAPSYTTLDIHPGL